MCLRGLKILGAVIVSIFILIGVGFSLNLVAYILPTNTMEQHVLESSEHFEKSYPTPTPKASGGMLDSFTDALMLLTAGHKAEKTAVEEALLNKRYSITKHTPDKTLYRLGTEAETQSTNNLTSTSYARYWHGYVAVLKPLLLVVDYTGLRIINGIVLGGLLLLLWKQYKSINEQMYMLPILFAFIFINPISIVLSLQFTGMVTLTLVALVMLSKYKSYFQNRPLSLIVFFTCLGGITSYVDLLTYPLITLGIPITYWITSVSVNRDSSKDIVKMISLYSVVWGAGYLGMWAGKWLLATYFTDINILQDALHAAAHRTSTHTENAEAHIWYGKVLSHIFKYSWGSILLVSALAGGYIFYKKYKCKEDIVYKIRRAYYPLFLIALMPFVWYLIFQNHSYVHSWFTFRELAITVYVLVVIGALNGKLYKD